MLSERDIKLFGRGIKLSEQVNYVVGTRFYVVRTTYQVVRTRYYVRSYIEATWPIVTKFHMWPLGVGGTKSCSNGQGQVTNMGAMPIYGKNLKKIISSRPNRTMT